MLGTDGIRTLSLDFAGIVLWQSECPLGHSKGYEPCSRLPDRTAVYCPSRIDRAGLRVGGERWEHICYGFLEPNPVRYFIPQSMECPSCHAIFIRGPEDRPIS
jgi:hypothetical protein